MFSNFHNQQQTGQLNPARSAKNDAIQIEKVVGLTDEAYKLSITKSGVKIEASDYVGAFNALQTWKHIVFQAKENIVPQLTIQDQPRFGYRGLMIDCSRHFWTEIGRASCRERV